MGHHTSLSGTFDVISAVGCLANAEGVQGSAEGQAQPGQQVLGFLGNFLLAL